MQPGQVTPNEFEIAVLECIAQANPWLRSRIDSLHVLSREFTGVGSYTKFQPGLVAADVPNGLISLDAQISMPGVSNGMGALLITSDGHPEFLEIYVNGDQYWSGLFDGFSLTKNA